ncbi:MAG TPA: hypothetical protein GXZ91_03810 [Christensenellaceae bacterium]|nr:hypothetical protein [Christensenellaceae bacterium]
MLLLEQQFYCSGFFGLAKLREAGCWTLCRLSKATPKWKRRTRKRWVKGNIV